MNTLTFEHKLCFSKDTSSKQFGLRLRSEAFKSRFFFRSSVEQRPPLWIVVGEKLELFGVLFAFFGAIVMIVRWPFIIGWSQLMPLFAMSASLTINNEEVRLFDWEVLQQEVNDYLAENEQCDKGHTAQCFRDSHAKK